MKILITGGAGFIGSHTADALIERGHQVRLLDNLHKTVHPKGRPDHLNPEAEFIEGDVRSKADWQNCLRGIDAVYHFAAYQDYLTDFSTFFHTNTVSTALLYEVIVENRLQEKIKKIIVAASQAVMGEGRYRCPACSEEERRFIYPEIRTEEQLSRGDWEHKCPLCRGALTWLPSDENVVRPCNQYALSKYSQEQIALQIGKRYRIPSVVMRYSIVQGPRQSFYNTYSGAMRIFALSLLLDKAPVIFEDGRQIRDFVNIKDVVEANLLVLNMAAADGHTFNVGGGKAWSVFQFYETMQQIVGRKKDPILSGHYRYGDTRHIFSDITRLQTLGWNPAHDVADSIQSYWEYLNRQREVENVLDFAQQHMKDLQVIRQVRQPS